MRVLTARFIPTSARGEAGLKSPLKQFSFPGGISSHAAPTAPGSIPECGEIGYSLSHAFGGHWIIPI
jgi:xylulose-5-phosphate/fructose-6-phosphate phosphoketolase